MQVHLHEENKRIVKFNFIAGPYRAVLYTLVVSEYFVYHVRDVIQAMRGVNQKVDYVKIN